MPNRLSQQPEPFSGSLASLWVIWSALAAGILLPLGITLLPLALPHPATPPLSPQALANLAYGLGIGLAAAALLLRKRWQTSGGHLESSGSGADAARYCQAVLLSGVLADGIAWLGFLAWLADSRTPAFYTLLAMAAIVFWLTRPRAEEWQNRRGFSATPDQHPPLRP